MFWRLRKFIRNRTNPIDKATATAAKEKLALVYALLAWNLFGFTFYQFLKINTPETHGVTDYPKMLGIKNATIMKFDGFTKTEEFKVQFTDEDIESFYNRSKNSDKKEISEVKSSSEEIKNEIL